MAGKRISGTHTTVIPSAETVARFALGLPSVKKVGLGEITMAKSARNSEPKIIIRELNPSVLQVKVIAKGKAQLLRVSTRDQKKAIEALERQFSDSY